MHSRHTDKTVRANTFTNASRGPGDIERIVLHTTESPEDEGGATNVANFFAGDSTQVSAHYVVDNRTIVACVEEEDIAAHAAGDNTETIGIEMVGKASQSREKWADNYSKGVRENTAKLAADLAKRYDIPVRQLTDAQLRARARGFVSHDAVSRVFGDDIRDDPGPHFPWNDFLSDVKNIMEGADKMVRFVLSDGEGRQLAQSSPVDETFDEEKARLAAFLETVSKQDDTVGSAVRELRDDKDVKIRRVQAD